MTPEELARHFSKKSDPMASSGGNNAKHPSPAVRNGLFDPDKFKRRVEMGEEEMLFRNAEAAIKFDLPIGRSSKNVIEFPAEELNDYPEDPPTSESNSSSNPLE